MKLDPWQKEVLATKGNICIRTGRQVGKSTVVSVKAAEYAAKNKNKTILVIASVERQASLLFEKIMDVLFTKYKSYIKTGKDKPTKHKVHLTNGSVIHCLPTGLSGHGIRGYTVDLLIADEAAFIPEDVWTAVTPMLAVTKGTIILLSTPFGRGGYFYRCFQDKRFTPFHVSSEECPRADEAFLESERERMTKLQYAQEYLGEFIDELRQFFPNDVIKKCMVLERGLTSPSFGHNYLGVDVARMGEDDSVFVSLVERQGKLIQVGQEVTSKTLLTDTTSRIKHLDKVHNYRKIYIDDGGMGVGVFDPLLEDPQTKRKVVAINNATRGIDRTGKRKTLLKEDLYSNLLHLMETDKIKLYNYDETLRSLRSVQAEYVNGKLKIFGNYTHIAEALIRAAWCMKDKTLNIWIA